MVALAPLRDGPVAFVAVAGGDGPQAVRLPPRHEQIGALTDALHAEVVAPSRPRTASGRGERWLALGDLVLGPALDRLGDVSLLYLVPYGALHAVPWHAAPVAGRPLVEQVPLAMMPTATTATLLGAAPAARPSRDSLVVGDPLGDLKHARAEAQAVADRLAVRPLLGADARRADVAARLAQATWAHFAAHGVFQPTDPMASGIVLADGTLAARDLLGLDGARSVVVSTCESGRQRAAVGDELWGLARALLYTGTATAVLSLWRVADDVTRVLMDRFYDSLLAEPAAGIPHGAEALRRAMIATRADHPQTFLWAPFALFGSPW
jgi:CHAT domain-containing protein